MDFNLEEIIGKNKIKNSYVYKDTENLDFEYRYVGKYTYNIKLLYGEGLYRIIFFVNDLEKLLIMNQIFINKEKSVVYEKYNEIKNFFLNASIKDLTEKFITKNNNY